jgi:hypothetical protein
MSPLPRSPASVVTLCAPPLVRSRRRVGGDAKIEEYLDKKGVKWDFHPKVERDQFDTEKSLRNQARFQALDEKRVDTYAEAMKRGDEFPPVIAHGSLAS